MIPKKITIAFLLAGLLVTLCLLALTPTCVEAGSGIGEEEVRAAVQTWVRYVTADARPDAVVVRMEPYQMDGETVAYIAHLAGGGFCLCGADDLVLPVYFYSPCGTYDPDNPDYQYILWEIGTRLEYLRKGLEEKDPKVLQYQGALSDRAEFWQDLIAGRIPRRVSRPKAPLAEPERMELKQLTSQWSQGSANPGSGRFNTFNAMCPVLTPNIAPGAPITDEHTIVGCTATAMAQIMRYWEWPNTGVGNASVNYVYRWRTTWDEEPLANDPGIPAGWPWDNRLEWTAAGGGRLRMNGYWDDSLYGSAQAISLTYAAYQTALANLWSDAGFTHETDNYAVDFGATTYDWSLMQDTQAASGSVSNAEMAKLSYHAGVAVGMDYGITGSGAWPGTAAQDHFRYDPDVTQGARVTNTMTAEIQWLRPPMLIGWNASGGGHTWVILGYDKANDPNRQFKMNMGWGGNDDGWYSCDNVPGGLNLNQEHVIRIAPLDVVKFVGNNEPGDGSPDDPYKNIREAIALPPVGAPDGATLIFKAGSVNTFTGTLVITRPCTLRGYNVVIRREE